MFSPTLQSAPRKRGSKARTALYTMISTAWGPSPSPDVFGDLSVRRKTNLPTEAARAVDVPITTGLDSPAWQHLLCSPLFREAVQHHLGATTLPSKLRLRTMSTCGHRDVHRIQYLLYLGKERWKTPAARVVLVLKAVREVVRGGGAPPHLPRCSYWGVDTVRASALRGASIPSSDSELEAILMKYWKAGCGAKTTVMTREMYISIHVAFHWVVIYGGGDGATWEEMRAVRGIAHADWEQLGVKSAVGHAQFSEALAAMAEVWCETTTLSEIAHLLSSVFERLLFDPHPSGLLVQTTDPPYPFDPAIPSPARSSYQEALDGEVLHPDETHAFHVVDELGAANAEALVHEAMKTPSPRGSARRDWQPPRFKRSRLNKGERNRVDKVETVMMKRAATSGAPVLQRYLREGIITPYELHRLNPTLYTNTFHREDVRPQSAPPSRRHRVTAMFEAMAMSLQGPPTSRPRPRRPTTPKPGRQPATGPSFRPAAARPDIEGIHGESPVVEHHQSTTQ